MCEKLHTWMHISVQLNLGSHWFICCDDLAQLVHVALQNPGGLLSSGGFFLSFFLPSKLEKEQVPAQWLEWQKVGQGP